MRIYGWHKTPEDPTRCIESVHNRYSGSYQCSRKRGHGPDGLYCKQHGRIEEERVKRNEL
jgi:hypothetical protein